MIKFWVKILQIFILVLSSFYFQTGKVMAQADSRVLGIHILHPEEVDEASELLSNDDVQTDSSWRYLTIPITLDDLDQAKWQKFFDESKTERLIPIIRLSTRFENGAWVIPTRQDLVRQISFLGKLTWPTQEKFIIVLNEVNHSNEFGHQLNPAAYANLLYFTTSWAKTEEKNFVVLPAAMDLAAGNGIKSREAFTYLSQMLLARPEVFDQLDFWNSHSYPNPGFSSSPRRVGQNSLRGFDYELKFIKSKTGKDFNVFITETGWKLPFLNQKLLTQYYQYALKNIWSDSRVMAVTPFVLQGSPGPFAGFSFLNETGEPTSQYMAFKSLF